MCLRTVLNAVPAQPYLCCALAFQGGHGAVTSQLLYHAGFPSKQNYILEIAAEDLESGEKWGTLVRIPEKVGPSYRIAPEAWVQKHAPCAHPATVEA